MKVVTTSEMRRLEQTAGELGLSVDIVATEHTIDGLVTAMEEHFVGGGDTG